MTTQPSVLKLAPAIWNPWQRVAFRFGFILGVLYIYPLPFGMLPYTDSVAELLSKPWGWLYDWFADSVMGVGIPVRQPTGSGDTLLAYVSTLVIILVAALGAAVWSIVDRKRKAYPRLASGMWVALRYLLAYTLLAYGFAKLINTQFPPPSPARLDQPVGALSPMGLLWTFQGSSTAYTFFGGLVEAVAGVLLLSRRTTMLGALIAITVMTNVVMLNLCYDVPVKLYSVQLLCIATLIALPQLRRVLRAILGHAVTDVPRRARSSRRRERVRLLVKLAAIALIAHTIYGQVTASISRRRRAPSELHGVWKVDRWTADGRDVAAPWRKLIFTTRGGQIVTAAEKRVWIGAVVLPGAQVIAVKPDDKDDNEMKIQPDLWHYTHRAPERLVIERIENGKQLHITCTRQPEPLLVTRDFHWIQELPFNR